MIRTVAGLIVMALSLIVGLLTSFPGLGLVAALLIFSGMALALWGTVDDMQRAGT